MIIKKKKNQNLQTLWVYYFILKNTVLRSYQELTRTVKCNPQHEEQDIIVNAFIDYLRLDENEFCEIKIYIISVVKAIRFGSRCFVLI